MPDNAGPGNRRRDEREAVLKALAQTWARWPEQRLCQLVVNATNRDDPFYVEDADLIGALNRYAR